MHQQHGGAITSITSAFLHGGFSHLIGNMIFLWVFGRRVEDACGAWRFLGYYLFCAVFSGIITVLSDPSSSIPGIGASGAIFGLMGAYLLIYPGGRIRTLVWLPVPFIVPFFPRIRAIWIILVYLIVQIPPALNVLAYGAGTYQVGYWAHLGGFFAAVFFPFFIRPEAFERYVNDVPV
jgi:membrane associated rhomboid family serine protease